MQSILFFTKILIKYICEKGKEMFYRNIFEYLESQQNPDDIYYRYRKQKEKMKLKFEAQAAGEYLYNEAAATLEKAIQKIFDSKQNSFKKNEGKKFNFAFYTVILNFSLCFPYNQRKEVSDIELLENHTYSTADMYNFFGVSKDSWKKKKDNLLLHLQQYYEYEIKYNENDRRKLDYHIIRKIKDYEPPKGKKAKQK